MTTLSDYTDNSDCEEEITEEEQEGMWTSVEKHIDFELDFFSNLGRHYFLHNFEDHSHPNTEQWKTAPLVDNPLVHLVHTVDQDTLDTIKSGLKISDVHIRSKGDTKWTKDELKVIFEYAQLWVDRNDMGRSNYLNDICWVASKIMAFQSRSHSIKNNLYL